MILSAERILSDYRELARRHAWLEPSEPAVRAAVKLASSLAHDRREEETAAVLYAFASFRRAFPGAWRMMAVGLAREQALAAGCRLVATKDDFDRILSRVMYGEASFEDVRSWTADRLVSLRPRAPH